MSARAAAAPIASVVIASRNEGENLRNTVDGFLQTLPERTEIVVVDDCSTDGSAGFLKDGYGGVTLVRPRRQRGAAAARNAGVGRARGEIVVFADAHVEPPPGWLGQLTAALEDETAGLVGPGIASITDPAQVGYGHVWVEGMQWRWQPRRADEPYAVPFIGAGFIAMRRDVFRQVGGFDHGLLIWGSIGDELCIRLWLLGYECHVVPTVVVPHLFRIRHPYEVNWREVVHNQMRLAVLHFAPDRVSRLIQHLAGRTGFSWAMEHLVAGDAWRLRDHYRTIRIRDDDWFFDEFGIDVV